MLYFLQYAMLACTMELPLSLLLIPPVLDVRLMHQEISMYNLGRQFEFDPLAFLSLRVQLVAHSRRIISLVARTRIHSAVRYQSSVQLIEHYLRTLPAQKVALHLLYATVLFVLRVPLHDGDFAMLSGRNS